MPFPGVGSGSGAGSGSAAIARGIQKLWRQFCESAEEEKEEKCFKAYQRDLDYCDLFYKANGARWYAQCKKEAFGNYQRCRGFSSPD